MEHLVAFEYGTGAVWSFITGATPAEIVASVPELRVYDEPPMWMTQADLEELHQCATFELNGSASTLLDKIIASRLVAAAALVD